MSGVITDSVPRQSLLQKYDIPIDHLDFAFVKTCTKVKELEKIIKILRSKEEGYYPDLLKAAENKLSELDPSNRFLRVEGQLLTKDNLEPQYWKQIFDDIEKWSDECTQKEKEKELLTSKGSEPQVTVNNVPPIRRPPRQMDKKCEGEKKINEKKSGCDYNKWDKFDADAECLKMDLEEEKRQQDPPPSAVLDSLSDLDSLAKEASQAAVSMTKSEKELLANKEKEVGNEFYKAKDYKQAVRSYTKSIAVFPTSFAYNNRAAAFLNMERYDMAVTDTNLVIQMDPDNVKALYRRAQAYEKLSEFSKALSDLNSILKLEPDNNLAKTMKEKMKNKKSTAKPKSSAASSAKRSKLTLESKGEGKKGSGSNSGGSGSSINNLSGGRGEPMPGPSGVNTKNIAKQPVSAKRIATTENKTSGPNENVKKRGMRKVDVLEVDREDDSSMFDWRRYLTEGRSARIEVASKFREKSSREPRPRSESESSREDRDVSISEPVTPEYPVGLVSSEKNEPHRPYVLSRPLHLDPANFTQSWELLTRERAPLSDKAKLLRSVRPHLLQAVIGNKLEEGMLSDFLYCLRDEFKLKTEFSLVVEYLTSFAHLDRFNIIKTFLPSQIKQVIQDLMDRTNAGESLRKLYM